jgi:hypothetical protein
MTKKPSKPRPIKLNELTTVKFKETIDSIEIGDEWVAIYIASKHTKNLVKWLNKYLEYLETRHE